MTRKECEKKLLDQLEAAWDLFKAVYPEAEYLNMFATADGCCVMGGKPSADGKERVVDGYLSPDGYYLFSE